MLINLQALIDEQKCYETVRQLRWTGCTIAKSLTASPNSPKISALIEVVVAPVSSFTLISFSTPAILAFSTQRTV
jgi:hypothetical protein